MTNYAEKSQENISQNKTNSVYQNKSNENATLQLADNRVEAVAQKELQETINSSPRIMQLKAFQDMADNRPNSKAIQLQELANNYTAKTQMKAKVGINDDVSLEKEADVMGAKALQAKKSENEEIHSYTDKAIDSSKIQMVVNPDATDYKLDMFSVVLSHENSRNDGYNFKLIYKALFRDDHYHNPELLEFIQEVGSIHTYTEPGHAHPTVQNNWGWHDDGYSRTNQPQFYDDGIFNGVDLPGTSGMDAGVRDITFVFRSRQRIRVISSGEILATCIFPTVTMVGDTLLNMQTTPANGTKAEYVFKVETDEEIPDEAFDANVDF